MKTIFVVLALFAVAFAAVESRGRLGFGIVQKVLSKVRGDDQEESVEHEPNEGHRALGFGGHGQRIVQTEDHEHDEQGKHSEHCGHVEHARHHHGHAQQVENCGSGEHAEQDQHAGQVEHSGLGEQAEQGEHDGFGGHDGLSEHEGDAEIDYDKIPNPFDKRFEPEEDKSSAGGFGAQGDAEIDYDKIPNPFDKRFESEEAEPNSQPKRKDCRA